MPERRDLRQQLRLDVVAGDEELRGLDRGLLRRLHEILALDGEEPHLLAVLARGEELPDEPELLVLARLDQAASDGLPSSSAALARSATRANAPGSETARSAS